MVDAAAGCVWGWLRPSRVDVPAAAQAGCLGKDGAAARRRAGATVQACTVVASAIYRRKEGTSTSSLPPLLLRTGTGASKGGRRTRAPRPMPVATTVTQT